MVFPNKFRGNSFTPVQRRTLRMLVESFEKTGHLDVADQLRSILESANADLVEKE